MPIHEFIEDMKLAVIVFESSSSSSPPGHSSDRFDDADGDSAGKEATSSGTSGIGRAAFRGGGH